MLNLSNRGGHLGFLTHTKSENKVYVIIHVQLKFHPVSSFQSNVFFTFSWGSMLKL